MTPPWTYNKRIPLGPLPVIPKAKRRERLSLARPSQRRTMTMEDRKKLKELLEKNKKKAEEREEEKKKIRQEAINKHNIKKRQKAKELSEKDTIETAKREEAREKALKLWNTVLKDKYIKKGQTIERNKKRTIANAFIDGDYNTKQEEQEERLSSYNSDKVGKKLYEDQISLLMFVEGSTKKDPPSNRCTNPFQTFGNKKIFWYNYFVGKTATGKVLEAILNTHWVEDIFVLPFVELCCLQPGKWFHVPLGASDETIEPAPSDLLTEIKVFYPQQNTEFCLVNSVASALNYLRYFDEAQAIYKHADEVSILPGNQALLRVVELMELYVPKWGRSTIYNRRRRKQKPRVMTMDELITPSQYITLVQPIGNDGGADHIVCVIHDLIFDTRYDHALKLKAEAFHWICGIAGLCRLGTIHRFENASNATSQKNMEYIRKHW